jgi:AcrR family transcriptional regulator
MSGTQHSRASSGERSRPRRSPGRPVQGDVERTRRIILNAATAIFSARGYGGTTLREIADASDLTVGTLHHHFPTKQELYEAAFEDAAAELYKSFLELVQSHCGLASRLRALLHAILDPSEVDRQRLNVILRGWIDQNETHAPLHMPAIVDKTLTLMADEAVEHGEIRQNDVPVLKATWRAMAWGVIVLNLNGQNQEVAAAAVDGLLRGFIRSLASEDVPPARPPAPRSRVASRSA